MALFRQVPVSFQHLENLKIKYFHVIEEREFFLADKINFHDTPLKHISIVISVPYVAYSPDNLCDVPKNIAETCLAKLSKTIKSFQLKYPNPHTTPLHLMGMENNLCNLVKLGISISVFADIDTLFRAAPRLRYLELAYADIKVKDELYNSERFKLRSFGLTNSTITSDVLQFLSFHCRNLDTLSLIDDIPPKQEYDPKVLSTVSGGTSVKTHYDFFYKRLEKRKGV
ncbi:hypothetical protein CLU79DRAFT_841859 [Phycomyces nitens]|nr:hypothetical protein CLU79DRAFT_841859 [Phycomyces nitens]